MEKQLPLVEKQLPLVVKLNKIKILFIYFIGIFVFCANVYSAQIDLSSGQTWGTTRGAIQSNFDEVYSAILNTYISALIGGNINGDLVTSGTIGDSRLSTNIPLLNGTQTITGTWSFPDLGYNVTSWDGILTPATKNSLRDYFYIFDADGDGDFTEESWTCSVVDLVLGPNVLELIATDSEGQTGSDSVTVTRTQPGYSTRGSGYTIKGCSLK